MKKTNFTSTFKRLLPILLLVVSTLSWGQGSYRSDSAFNNLGVPIPNPTIRVCQSNATGIPCTPLATIFTDQTLGTPAANPFSGDSFGNFNFFAAPGWYQVQVSGPGVSPVTYKVLLPPDVGNILSLSVGTYTSTTANPAASGAQRLGAGDQICWRNAGNTADVCLSKNGSDQIVGAAASAPLISQSTNPASAGTVRLAASDTLCWRNNANNGDICISKNGSDQLVGVNATASSPFTSSSVNPALSGILRLANADTICGRNAGNTGDICLDVDSSNFFDAGANPFLSAAFITNTATPAATGVLRLATGDTYCWRNNGNTADVCISKSTADAVNIPKLTLGADTGKPMTATPLATISMANTASSTSTATHMQTTTMEAIVVYSFDVFLGTTGAGCTTQAIYALRVGGVTQLSNTTVNGTNFYHATGNISIPNASTLTFEVTQGAAGCTTSPGSPRYVAWFSTQ